MEIPNWWWYNVVLQFGPIIHGDGHVDISEDGFLAVDGRMEFWGCVWGDYPQCGSNNAMFTIPEPSP